MLKEREIYTATKGVENEGYEFEVGMLSFYCFHLCYNDAISDFKIAIYDDQYHPFDDIVIDITTRITEKYAIQLKHVKDKLLLNSNHFGKNGKMVLSKYFKYDFTKSDHVVLLTNGVVNEEITVCGFYMKNKTLLTGMEKCLDTCCAEDRHIYEICNEENCNKITLYTSQKNRYDIDEEIKHKFKEKFSLDDDTVDGVVQKFKNFFQQWKKGCYELCKLDKQDIRMKIAEILFYEHIVEYRPQFEQKLDTKAELLQKVLNSFNITILPDVEEDTINGLCGFDLEKKKLIEDGQKLLIIANDSGFKELAIILWRLKKFPLIVRINGKKKMIHELMKNLQDEHLCFILVGNICKQDFKVREVFENLTDLRENEFYEAISQEFKFSIQGQKEISLKELNLCNPRFSEIITMKELLLISKENFLVGESEENLPEPYIPRRLVTTILKINSVEHFPNDLFAISGSPRILRKKLSKCKFWSFDDFVKKISLDNRLPPRSIILCEEDVKSFATCLKYKNSNVHCLRILDSEHLQLIYSKEKSESLRQFRVLPEDQLHRILKSNINLVCARPGMGKLTMLKYLKNNAPPGYWTIKVDLQENRQLQDTFQNNSTFDSKVENCFKEVRRIIFFFCGIDNLQNDALIRAIEYIQQLARDNFKVWVFSENHLKETLEKVFEVPSLDIEEFSEEEQQRYIQERLKEQQVDQGLEKVLKSFKMLKNNDILGAPMHLYMLTEIFINNPKASMEELFVLTDIYRYFIKTKYQHYLTKVYSDHCNQIIEDGIYYRTEQYKLAAISCLDSVYFKKVNTQCDRNFLHQIYRIGDVVGIIFKVSTDGTIIFSQETYADYFAALWLANNFQKLENIKNFIFREEFKNIFFMFNLEICKNHPVQIAVLYQNCEQLERYQTKLNEVDPLRRSSLHLACSYGTKYPKLQVSKGRTFKLGNKETEKEDTESRKILDYLVKNTQTDPLQNDGLLGWNLFDYAFNVLNVYAIEKILAKYPETSSTVFSKLQELSEDLFTVIYYSVRFGYENLVRLASQTSSFSSTLSVENCNGESLLFLAVKSGSCNVVNILLDNKGAKINAITSIYNKRSALHLAVENDYGDIVDLLLQRGACVDIMDRYRNTPLHLASSKGLHHSAQILLKYFSDVNFADNFGRTSLQLSATHGHIKIVKLLLRKGAKIDKCDRFGNSPMSCAVDKNHQDIASLLAKEGAPTVSTRTRRPSATEFDEYTSHQLHWVAYTGQTERIEPLLQDGWDINEVDHFGRTPLYRAVTEKYPELVEMFISRNSDINIPDNNKIVPLCKAISNNDHEMTNLLLKKDASLDVKDDFNYTPLHWAAMGGNLEIIKLLMNKNPDVDAVDDFGRKPIHCAVENGHHEAVKVFEAETGLAKVAEMRAQFLNHYESGSTQINTTRLSPFQEAINSGNSSLVKKFLKLDKNINFEFSLLCSAVVKKHKELVELFLQNGGEINTSDKSGSSLLHWAAFCGNLDIIKFLIGYKIDINAVDGFGYNSVEVAAMNGRPEVLSVLLKEGANAKVVDKCGNSPLDWACKKGHYTSVEVLLAVLGTTHEDFLDKAKKQHKFLKISTFC